MPVNPIIVGETKLTEETSLRTGRRKIFQRSARRK